MKNMSKEELLIQYESLLIRFVKEDDMGLDITKTQIKLDTIKKLILERMVD